MGSSVYKHLLSFLKEIKYDIPMGKFNFDFESEIHNKKFKFGEFAQKYDDLNFLKTNYSVTSDKLPAMKNVILQVFSILEEEEKINPDDYSFETSLLLLNFVMSKLKDFLNIDLNEPFLVFCSGKILNIDKRLQNLDITISPIEKLYLIFTLMGKLCRKDQKNQVGFFSKYLIMDKRYALLVFFHLAIIYSLEWRDNQNNQIPRINEILLLDSNSLPQELNVLTYQSLFVHCLHLFLNVIFGFIEVTQIHAFFSPFYCERFQKEVSHIRWSYDLETLCKAFDKYRKMLQKDFDNCFHFQGFRLFLGHDDKNFICMKANECVHTTELIIDNSNFLLEIKYLIDFLLATRRNCHIGMIVTENIIRSIFSGIQVHLKLKHLNYFLTDDVVKIIPLLKELAVLTGKIKFEIIEDDELKGISWLDRIKIHNLTYIINLLIFNPDSRGLDELDRSPNPLKEGYLNSRIYKFFPREIFTISMKGFDFFFANLYDIITDLFDEIYVINGNRQQLQIFNAYNCNILVYFWNDRSMIYKHNLTLYLTSLKDNLKTFLETLHEYPKKFHCANLVLPQDLFISYNELLLPCDFVMMTTEENDCEIFFKNDNHDLIFLYEPQQLNIDWNMKIDALIHTIPVNLMINFSKAYNKYGFTNLSNVNCLTFMIKMNKEGYLVIEFFARYLTISKHNLTNEWIGSSGCEKFSQVRSLKYCFGLYQTTYLLFKYLHENISIQNLIKSLLLPLNTQEGFTEFLHSFYGNLLLINKNNTLQFNEGLYTSEFEYLKLFNNYLAGISYKTVRVVSSTSVETSDVHKLGVSSFNSFKHIECLQVNDDNRNIQNYTNNIDRYEKVSDVIKLGQDTSRIIAFVYAIKKSRQLNWKKINKPPVIYQIQKFICEDLTMTKYVAKATNRILCFNI